MDKQVEALKEETNKSLKEIQEITKNQVEELNKIIQERKMELDTIKKSQMEETLQIDNPGQTTGATDASITNKIQDTDRL